MIVCFNCYENGLLQQKLWGCFATGFATEAHRNNLPADFADFADLFFTCGEKGFATDCTDLH
jgi:hypothetical protein